MRAAEQDRSDVKRKRRRWRGCPAEYRPYTTVYSRCNRWSRRRIWQRISQTLVEQGEIGATVALDMTSVKAHRLAAGA